MKVKKEILDLRVTLAERLGAQCILLKAKPESGHLPECRPGQFAQLRTDTLGALLRRPISIHDVEGDEVSFLVQVVGHGTRWLASLVEGDLLNVVMPLGNGFSTDDAKATKGTCLLVGGGVGVAPLYYLGKELKQRGVPFAFLLGARTKDLLFRLDAFRALGPVFVTTEDGSEGERGFVTQHSLLGSESDIERICVCGPTPMMKAVARYARERNIPCEVSLENHMACGVGACLCCVTETSDGHNRCVCTEGPVFDALQLKE